MWTHDSQRGKTHVYPSTDGVGLCGSMTLKEEKRMFTPLQTVWVRVDPHFDNSNLVSALAKVV